MLSFGMDGASEVCVLSSFWSNTTVVSGLCKCRLNIYYLYYTVETLLVPLRPFTFYICWCHYLCSWHQRLSPQRVNHTYTYHIVVCIALVDPEGDRGCKGTPLIIWHSHTHNAQVARARPTWACGCTYARLLLLFTMIDVNYPSGN